MNNNEQISKHKDEKDLKEVINDYLGYWYLFVLGLIISLGIAYTYLRYTTPRFLTQASVLIKDDSDAGFSGDLQSLFRFSGFSNRFISGRMENEVAVFKSKQLISEAIKELNLNITYETLGTIKSSELYPYKPITVKYLSFNNPVQNNPVPPLLVEIISTNEFRISISGSGNPETYSFGDTVTFPFGEVLVLPEFDSSKPKAFEKYIGNTISVRYRSLENSAFQFQKRLRIVNELKSSNVVALSMQSPVRSKSKDFLNELIRQYNIDASRDRNEVAENTARFIDSRLEIISKELDSVELGKAEFKSENKLTDIIAEAQLTLESSQEYDVKQLDLGTQMQLADYMYEYVDQSDSYALIPANVGIENTELSDLVARFNSLVLERERLLRNSTLQNPVIINLGNQLDGMRSGILESLQNQKRSLEITAKDVGLKESLLESRIRKVPIQEKIFRSIERQQTVKEQLYLFLLQQREQTSIALSIKSDKAKIVDSAYSTKVAVYPNRRMILAGAFLGGLLVPFGFLYLFFMFNTKIQSIKDVEMILPQIPMVGEIPKLGKQQDELVRINDRSILAESFRILRTNLQYLFVNKFDAGKEGNCIFVTSTIKGEGKTFVAFNLALTLALTGKEVVLVGADIRNPQLHRYLPPELKDKTGLTEYIVNTDLTTEDLVERSTYNENLSIVLSGVIPPNPAELLMQQRTEDFFKELEEKFDYVIVDTAPSMLVTDTILINKLSDVTLYVIRANYTDKKLLEFPQDAMEDGRLTNVALVLNNVEMNNFGYGNKYGYTYSNERISFWKRLFKRPRF